jgi:ribose transport system permease protein
MTSIAKSIRTRIPYRAGTIHITLVTFLVLYVAAAAGLDIFLDRGNQTNLLAQSTTLIISAIGQTFVLLTAGLDLSVGSIISMTTAIMAIDQPAGVRIFVAVTAAVTFGFVNGIGVARFNIHPIIMTLATMGIGQGIALLILPIPGGQVPDFLRAAVSGAIGPIPATVFWLLIAGFVGVWLQYRTTIGINIFAVGGHKENARLNGVRVERTIVTAYVLSALFACAAGMFLAGRLASGDPKGGAIFGIESVTAAALGGVNLAGGIGSVYGTILGGGVLVLINNIMSLMNISAFLQSVVKGALLLLLIITQRRKNIGL